MTTCKKKDVMVMYICTYVWYASLKLDVWWSNQAYL